MAISNLRFAINAPDVVAEDFDGQLVILNLANGHYYSLQGCGGDIWSLLMAGHTPDAVLAHIGTAAPAVYDDSVALLGRLIDLGLVRPDDAASAPSSSFPASWPQDSPRLEAYEDLAELIYADPIHDVDEQAGWPKQRQDT